MTHIYSTGESRRSAVFMAIIGLHLALFLLVINDRMPVIPDKARDPPTIAVLPPPPPREVVPPDALGPVESRGVVVREPPLEIPTFETPEAVPTAPTGDAEIPPRREPVARVAATLQGRSVNFANVIRACYPAGARRSGEEGRLLIAVLIGSQGQVRSWRVVQSTGFPRLDAAAPCVLARIGFNAAREDSTAVESEVLLPIVFRLD